MPPRRRRSEQLSDEERWQAREYTHPGEHLREIPDHIDAWLAALRFAQSSEDRAEEEKVTEMIRDGIRGNGGLEAFAKHYYETLGMPLTDSTRKKIEEILAGN